MQPTVTHRVLGVTEDGHVMYSVSKEAKAPETSAEGGLAIVGVDNQGRCISKPADVVKVSGGAPVARIDKDSKVIKLSSGMSGIDAGFIVTPSTPGATQPALEKAAVGGVIGVDTTAGPIYVKAE